MKQKHVRVASGGFTLIEAAIATVIVGVGVGVLLTAVAACTRVNSAGKELTQGVFLAQEIREWTLQLPFSDPDPGDQGNPPGPDGSDPEVFVDDLDDLIDVTYSPPRSAQGNALHDMADWSETLTFTWRDPDSLTTVVSPGSSDMIYVEVEIFNQAQPVLTTGWLVTRRD
jgi:Tfp pilus assembly protein PilV